MNRSEWLSDELLADTFEHRAARGSLDSLRAEILSATAAAHQRPTWLSRIADILPVGKPRPAVLAVLLLASLVGLLLAIALAGRQPPGPFNLGTLAFVRDGDVYLADPDGSNPRLVLHDNATLFSTVMWSPDGTKLAVDGESGVVLLDVAAGTPRLVGGNSPTWSPDGSELAVIVPPNLQAPAVRIVEAASGAVRAEFPFAAVNGLAWSPNGQWIAGTGNCTGSLCPAGATSNYNSVIRIDVRTGEVIQLDGRSGHLDAERHVAWSPDSRRVAYIRYAMDKGVRVGDPLIDVRDVIVADADGSNDVRVNPEHGRADQPAWSPDGQWIAFREGTHVAIEHPDGTAGRVVVDRQVRGFGWGPGSDRVWFTQDGPGGKFAVWEALLDGGARPLGFLVDHGSTVFGGTGLDFAFQVLPPGQATGSQPIGVPNTPTPTLELVTPPPAGPADPSGTWRGLLTENRELCELLSIATDSGAATKIADLCNPQPTQGSSGSWSPTGAAYAVVRDGRLSIIYPDGRVKVVLADLAGLMGVTWSPDGMWLDAIGTSTQGGAAASTFVLHPDGSGLSELAGSVSWSPNSQRLALFRTDQVLLMGQTSGAGLSPIGMFPLPATWSPDASRFGFVRDGNFWSASVDGTDVRNVSALPLGGATGATWSPDGQWIAVEATHGLWLMKPDATERRWLDVGRDQTVWSPVWSPDSTRLAVSTYAEGTASQVWRTYLVAIDRSPTLQIDETWDVSWSPDGRFLVGADASSDSSGDQRGLVLMNADGSGRRVLRSEGFGNTPVWLR